MSMGRGQGGWGDHRADNAPLMSNSGAYQGGGPGGGPSGYPGGAGVHPGGAAGYPPSAGPYGDPYGQQSPIGGGGLKTLSTGNYMNDVFFAAACCIVLGSLIGGTAMLASLELVDWLQMTYLLFFGLILAVLDTPLMKTIKMVMDAKMYIGKYIQFVTRLTGKGVTLVFLGSALFMTMWDTLKGWFMETLAVVLCIVPVLVGICAVVIGVLKSLRLNKARTQLSPVIEQRYDAMAQTYPGPNGGLTMHEFNRLISENTNRIEFETLDLKLIFNALVSNPSWRQQAQTPQSAQGGYANVATGGEELKIPKQDLLDWCRGGMVFL